MEEKIKFYSSKRIREKNAIYNVIFGERSNGKTFDILYNGLQDYFKSGEVNQLALIRRWDEEFVGPNSAKTSFDSLMHDGNGKNQVKKLSKGKYDGVEYWSGRFYLTVIDPDTGKLKRTDKVVAYGFSLSGSEHYKSASFPHIKTIFFDEFLTRKYYLPDEFITFQNLISTIVRQRSDVKIFMCGNTVNMYNPYFKEMGLYKAKFMQQGDIDVYTYGETGLTVAVEYSDSPNKSKPSDIYFAFQNPRLEMIKTGAWEIDIYPHCPTKYKPNEILFVFFVLFDDNILQCEIVQHEDLLFVFVHRKTTPLKNTDSDLIYSTVYDARPNHRRNILKPTNPMEKRIYKLFATSKVFYQDNEVGEVMRNYLVWCKHGT